MFTCAKKRVKIHDLCLVTVSAFSMISLCHEALRQVFPGICRVQVSRVLSPSGCNVKLTAES